MRKPLLLGLVGLGACALAGSFSHPAQSEPASTADVVLKGRGSSVGSALALADFRGVPVAIVADEDDSMVRVFELSPAKEIASAKVPGTPSQVLVTKSGSVLVALKDKGKVAILEPKGGDARQLIQRGSIDTGGEPVALATTPDESMLLVASGWTHTLASYSLADKTRKMEVSIGREPRTIAVASDGSRAFVTHASTGAFTTVDLANQKTSSVSTKATLADGTKNARVGTQGFAMATQGGKVFVPAAFADPSAQETYYGSGMETMGVLVVDEVNATVAKSSETLAPLNAYGTPEKCLLPRAAAVTSDGKKLVVGCAGEKDLMVFDATAASPRTKVLTTRSAGEAPSAIAIDNGTNNVIAWSQMGHTLSVVSLADKPTARDSVVAGKGLDPAIERGRKLFVATDGRMAADGRACASCHTDGRDDGFVWNTPEGKRQTPMLAGRLSDTAPYGWTRDAKTFHDYVNETVSRLRGKGFSKSELDDLSAYVMSIKAPPKDTTTDEEKTKLVAHGKEVFASSEAGCASCHSGNAMTDNKKHPVDAKDKTEFATPSLRFVAGTAPYFHDGRYSTLHELLTGNDPNMSKGKDLPEKDLSALEAYLTSL